MRVILRACPDSGRGRGEQSDFFEQCAADVFDFGGVFEFSAVFVEDIEHVDDLIDAGIDAGEVDGESEIVECAGEGEEQSLGICGEDVDDCVVL